MFDVRPYTQSELWEAFHQPGGFSKHLLTVYSMAVGLNATRIVDLGIGTTTRALRFAAQTTGGTVFSCDANVKRFSHLLEEQDDHWKFSLSPSENFLRQIEAPIDFVVHDGAHDYHQVKLDLELLLPKMRTFGLICLHDTQQPQLSHDMLSAVRDAVEGWQVSFVSLPYSCGLSIIRLEAGEHPAAVHASGPLPDGRPDTEPVPCPVHIDDGLEFDKADTSTRRKLRWKLRKIVKGY